MIVSPLEIARCADCGMPFFFVPSKYDSPVGERTICGRCHSRNMKIVPAAAAWWTQLGPLRAEIFTRNLQAGIAAG